MCRWRTIWKFSPEGPPQDLLNQTVERLKPTLHHHSKNQVVTVLCPVHLRVKLAGNFYVGAKGFYCVKNRNNLHSKQRTTRTVFQYMPIDCHKPQALRRWTQRIFATKMLDYKIVDNTAVSEIDDNLRGNVEENHVGENVQKPNQNIIVRDGTVYWYNIPLNCTRTAPTFVFGS